MVNVTTALPWSLALRCHKGPYRSRSGDYFSFRPSQPIRTTVWPLPVCASQLLWEEGGAGVHYRPHFPDEESEAQQGRGAPLGPHSLLLVVLKLKLASIDFLCFSNGSKFF